MTIRLSTGLRNHLLSGGSWRSAFNGGSLEIYTGAQPATADTAISGTKLVTITNGSGALTVEVKPTGTAVLAGVAGTVTALKIGGEDIMGATATFVDTLTNLAIAVRDIINRNPRNLRFVATASSATVTITARPGIGANINGTNGGTLVTTGAGGITSTDTNVGSVVTGVTHVNGLLFESASAGSITKLASQTWSGVMVATGTAGWFRLKSAVADADATDSSEVVIRLDGSVAVSGGDLNLTSTSLVSAATETISTFTPTEPAA